MIGHKPFCKSIYIVLYNVLSVESQCRSSKSLFQHDVKEKCFSLHHMSELKFISEFLDEGLYIFNNFYFTVSVVFFSQHCHLPVYGLYIFFNFGLSLFPCFSPFPTYCPLNSSSCLHHVATQDPGHDTKFCDASFFFYLICLYYYSWFKSSLVLF